MPQRFRNTPVIGKYYTLQDEETTYQIVFEWQHVIKNEPSYVSVFDENGKKLAEYQSVFENGKFVDFTDDF